MGKDKVWVLQIESSIFPKKEKGVSIGKKKYWVYNSFETAKTEMRKLIQYYAELNVRAENQMFLADGHVKELDNYILETYNTYMADAGHNAIDMGIDAIAQMLEEEKESYEGLKAVPDLISHYVMNATKDVDVKKMVGFKWTDWMVKCEIKNRKCPTLHMCGVDDGPCNGVDPFFYINSFIMDDPYQTYYCCMRDQFDDYSFRPDYFYVELHPAEVE